MLLTLAISLTLGFTKPSSARISEDCGLFFRDQICDVDEENVIEVLENIWDELSCQEACHFSESCSHFTWFSLYDNHGTRCYLLSSCTSTSVCEADCTFSLSGPEYPSYKQACCGDFYGSGCDEDNAVLHIDFGVSDEYECQKLCQNSDDSSCTIFTFDSDVCILFSSCPELVPCSSCVTGPPFPALDVCEEPSVGVMVGGVGYNGYLATVEIADSGAICGGVIPNFPVGRKGANSALVAGRILTCGGQDWDKVLYPSCYSYDKADNQWSEVERMEESRAFFSMSKVAGRVVVTGGEGEDGFLSSAESYRNGKWSPEPELELTSARYRHCSVTLDDINLVVIGGKTKGLLNTILDVMEMKEVGGTGSWLGLPSMKQSREGHGCLVTTYQGMRGILVAGGYTGNPGRGAVTSHVEFYSLETGQWEDVPWLVQYREYHSLGMIGGHPSVFGGAKPEYLRSTEVFTGSEWVTGTELLTGRWAHSMVTVPKSFPRCPASNTINGTLHS